MRLSLVTRCLVIALGISPVSAFEAGGMLDGVSVEVFAPDWCWRGDAISVLIRLEVPATSPPGREFRAALSFPQDAFSFRSDADGVLQQTVIPGETHYLAIKGLVPRVDREQSEFELSLELRLGEVSERFDFPLRTVRGSMVPRGLWSILAPGVISLIALPVFLLFLQRRGVKRWWRHVDADIGGERGEIG